MWQVQWVLSADYTNIIMYNYNYTYMYIRVPPEVAGSSFFLGKVTALGSCVALPCLFVSFSFCISN